MSKDSNLLKLEFMNVVLHALKKLENKYIDCFKSIDSQRIFYEINCDKWYYKGHYWFCLELTPQLKRDLIYKDVVAIHIKPYQISNCDIKKAISTRKSKTEKSFFNEHIDGFVAYDKRTANFHKNTCSIIP